MTSTLPRTSSHALLNILAANGIDRVFLVPGESYLGILDALNDFPQIDTVTCRHEAGAAFMACADGRLSGRAGVLMVSRGPGAANAAIGIHTAQQDAVALIMVVGQVPKKDLRKGAFQEIDYQAMYGSIAKWVYEATSAEDLAAAAFTAIRIASSGTPGPVVLVVPEDIQQQPVAQPQWQSLPHEAAVPSDAALARVRSWLRSAQRPLIIAGGALERDGGRDALRALADLHHVPVAVSFRRHDLFPNDHPLFAGDLGLANPADQIAAFDSSDLLIALGTRLGDITTQGYAFPRHPRPSQRLVHCHPDAAVVGRHLVPDAGLVCDPVEFARALAGSARSEPDEQRSRWVASLRDIRERIARWPQIDTHDGVAFVDVVRCLSERAPADVVLCLDAGTFAAPVYRHFPFVHPQRMMAPLSGAMGYGVPAALACALRLPARKVVCLVGDGSFTMTGNEMIAMVERRLPVLIILSNNNSYGSIRIHQERSYPGRHVGTSLSNPDFTALARAFGVDAEHVDTREQVDGAIRRGLAAPGPYFIEVATSLSAVLPRGGSGESARVTGK